MKGTWPNWEAKWRRYRSRPGLRCLEDLGADPEALFDAVSQPEVTGVAVATAPERVPRDLEADPLALCVDAGLPVALFRREGAALDVRALSAELAPEDARDLPEWLRRRRASPAANEAPLALLWDDYDRLPPDVDPKFAFENVGKRSVG